MTKLLPFAEQFSKTTRKAQVVCHTAASSIATKSIRIYPAQYEFLENSGVKIERKSEFSRMTYGNASIIFEGTDRELYLQPYELDIENGSLVVVKYRLLAILLKGAQYAVYDKVQSLLVEKFGVTVRLSEPLVRFPKLPTLDIENAPEQAKPRPLMTQSELIAFIAEFNSSAAEALGN